MPEATAPGDLLFVEGAVVLVNCRLDGVMFRLISLQNGAAARQPATGAPGRLVSNWNALAAPGSPAG